MDVTPQIVEARRLLQEPAGPASTQRALGALAATALAALAAVLMAGAVILGPGETVQASSPTEGVAPSVLP